MSDGLRLLLLRHDLLHRSRLHHEICRLVDWHAIVYSCHGCLLLLVGRLLVYSLELSIAPLRFLWIRHDIVVVDDRLDLNHLQLGLFLALEESLKFSLFG